MSINSNVARHGNFTSSEIAALTKNGKSKGTFGAPFYTYVEEKNMERLLGRSLKNDTDAAALTWGKCVERRVFDILPIEYRLHSDETFEHRTIKCWAGSPDTSKQNLVGDVKSPLTLKSFCQLVEPIRLGLEGMDAINHIRENHDSGEKYYWQLVSNGIILGVKICQLIVYVPYKSELEEIRKVAREKNERAYNWIANAADEQIPYLIEGGVYKNLNIIEFPITEFDRNLLTERVLEGEKLLIPRPECYTTIIE